MCTQARTGRDTHNSREEGVCKDNGLLDASGICPGNQPHPGMFSLSDPWAEDEIQQPSVPLGVVLAQCVQIENINVITPSISGQCLNTFLIKKNASYINAQADVNLDMEPLCIKFQVTLE